MLRDKILEARREREKFFREKDSEISCRKAETVYRKDGVTRDWRECKRKEEMKKMEKRVSYVDLLVLLKAHKINSQLPMVW